MDQTDQPTSYPSWGSPPNEPVPMPYGPVPSPYAPLPIGPAGYPGGSPQGQGFADHPRGTTVLVLGILALSFVVTGPFAWYIGAKTQKEIAASGQHYANERDVHIGRLLGMISTLVWGALIVVYVIMIVAFVGLFASMLGSFPR